MEYKYINIDDEEISFTHDDIFIVFIGHKTFATRAERIPTTGILIYSKNCSARRGG